jgi:hypothetical protein
MRDLSEALLKALTRHADSDILLLLLLKLIFALHQAGAIALRRDVAKADVVWQLAKQWDARSNQHWHSRNHHSIYESSGEESLNRHAAIHVSVPEAAGLQLPHDFDRLPTHLLDRTPVHWREIEGTTAQRDHRLPAIECEVSEFQHDFESAAPHHHYIDGSQKLLEAVRYLFTCVQEVESVVQASKKAIDAYSAEN